MRGILGSLRFQYRSRHLERARNSESKDLFTAENLFQVNSISFSLATKFDRLAIAR